MTLQSLLRIVMLAVPLVAVACDEEELGPPTGSMCPKGSELTWENFGEHFMTTYCTGCHASDRHGDERHGAPKSYNFETVELVRKHLEDIDRMAAAGPDATNTIMPPKPPKPSLDERLQLGTWIACDAP